MALFEVHVHDATFSLTGGSRKAADASRAAASESRSRGELRSRDELSTGSDGGSGGAREKLMMLGVLALLVGVGIAYNRLRRYRTSKADEEEDLSDRLSSLGST